MKQRDWKKILGCPKIKVYNFLDYSIGISFKYGCSGIHYFGDVSEDIKKEANHKQGKLMYDYLVETFGVNDPSIPTHWLELYGSN